MKKSNYKLYLSGATTAEYYRNIFHKYDNFIRDIEIVDPIELVDQYYKDNPPKLVQRDLELIDRCDIFLAYMNRFTAGTISELFYAWHTKKPCLVISNDSLIREDYWIKVMTTRFFYTIDGCINFLNYDQDFLKMIKKVNKNKK